MLKVEAVAKEIRNNASTRMVPRVSQIGSLVINDSGNDGVRIGDLAENLTYATRRKSRKSRKRLSLEISASAILTRRRILLMHLRKHRNFVLIWNTMQVVLIFLMRLQILDRLLSLQNLRARRRSRLRQAALNQNLSRNQTQGVRSVSGAGALNPEDQTLGMTRRRNQL